jgi:hypothetical protein
VIDAPCTQSMHKKKQSGDALDVAKSLWSGPHGYESFIDMTADFFFSGGGI